MKNVRLARKINGHLKKGTPGRISDNDFKNWGVGPKADPWKIKVYFENDEMSVLNTDLELDGNDAKRTTKAQQQASLF